MFSMSSNTVFFRTLIISIILALIFGIINSCTKYNINYSKDFIIPFAAIFFAFYTYLRKDFVGKYIEARKKLDNLQEILGKYENNVPNMSNDKQSYKMLDFTEDILMVNLEKHPVFEYLFLEMIKDIKDYNLLEKINKPHITGNNAIYPYPKTAEYIIKLTSKN